MPCPSSAQCVSLIQRERQSANAADWLAVPVCLSLLDDQLTPVGAYRRLVTPDERTAPSFLFESVEGGERQGRHSVLGAQPALEVVARGHSVELVSHAGHAARALGHPDKGSLSMGEQADPLDVPRRLTKRLRLVRPDGPGAGARLPACFLGGWVGFAGYDTVRYAEPEKLGFATAPRDDRDLPDLHLAFYDGVVVFDHVQKLVHVVTLMLVDPAADERAIEELHAAAVVRLEERVGQLLDQSRRLPSGRMDRSLMGAPAALTSNLTRDEHAHMVGKALEYIRAGDIFQVVVGQRFERVSQADPFDVYRALRAVNPSPYMVYLQARGCILVASSPEILCRVREGVVTNRPLAGTRRRGQTPAEDKALEAELLADPKELAEHVMLVDLGRNDVGRVAIPGTIDLPARLAIERYSHVMHISSTVTGRLRPELDCWDALRAALPVGTISGAPKIRAMQVIDELEPVRRGPYGGGMGYVGLDGSMDIALTLRTMVVPVALRRADGAWTYHLQAAGGIVADSVAADEYQETVNKSAALARAIEVAEAAFGGPAPEPAGPRTATHR